MLRNGVQHLNNTLFEKINQHQEMWIQSSIGNLINSSKIMKNKSKENNERMFNFDRFFMRIETYMKAYSFEEIIKNR
jgi:hypothetical protein